jgi:methylthioribose-1-phosphate isomerase
VKLVLWLASNVWWLVPVAVGVLALVNLPMTLAVIRRVPVRVWLALGVVALLGLTFQAGRWYERSQHEQAQEAAEAKADAKAATVAKKAAIDAGKATAKIRERTEEAADEIEREMGAVDCAVPIPDRVRDELAGATRRAREALPAGTSTNP